MSEHHGEPGTQVGLQALLETSSHFIQVGRFDLAEERLIEGLGQLPNEPLVHYQLGLTYFLWDREEDAARHMVGLGLNQTGLGTSLQSGRPGYI